MQEVRSFQDAADWIFTRIGPRLRLGTPLGLGKPNQLLNLIFDRVKADPALDLEIYSALSLQIPQAKSDLERRFLNPFLDRHFGRDYPQLHYVQAAQVGELPQNIRVHEFYFQAGIFGANSVMQRQYISLNYTHVTKALFDRGLNVVVQLISPSDDGQHHSLSCNPDISLDLADFYQCHEKPLVMVGIVHPDLPVLGGDALVQKDFFDLIVETPELRQPLFALPREPIGDADMLIGLRAAGWVEDGGTLQIGIGSLSESVVRGLILRHQYNKEFADIRQWLSNCGAPTEEKGGHAESFKEGLYGTSEMLMDGFMHLRRAGILRREIFDRDEHEKRYLHGAFFLGSKEFYAWLRDLKGEDRQGLSMTRVSKVNDLYDAHELALRRQRKRARFFNTCLGLNLLGGAVSDTLPDGQVISGVGGQFNFVAMSHELEDSRSILMFRSARGHGRNRRSNIVWPGGNISIPRHLRDVVVTEYGAVSLRNRSDEEVVRALLSITEREFHDQLAWQAKKDGKLSANYRPPGHLESNTPEQVRRTAGQIRATGLFPAYPFGSDFTAVEERLSLALAQLKELGPEELVHRAWRGFTAPASFTRKLGPELERLQLDRPGGPSEFLFRSLVLGAFLSQGEPDV